MRTHIWVSFILLAIASAFSTSIALADTTFSLPTLSGKPIDRCVNDGRHNNCDSTANRIAATAF